MYLRYHADIKDRDNNSIRVEIYTKSFISNDEEVILTTDAITVEYCAETLFDSLKPSRAEINIMCANIMTELYSSSYNDTMVKIYKNSNLFWVGYIVPNIYNQPYKYAYDPITIECVDYISHLSDINYNSNNGITSLLSILGKCLALSDENHVITKMYVDSSITLDNNNKVLEYAYLEERNFYDEKEEPAKCDEVIGSILKCLGLTMIQYKDAFYIINQGGNLTSSYVLNEYEYTNGWSYKGTYTMNLGYPSMSDVGVAESNGQISLGDVYNKVTIISNNNPLDALLPDFDDSADLVNQNSDSQHYEQIDYTANDTSYKLLGAYFNSSNNWYNYNMYVLANAMGTPAQVSEMHMTTLRDSYGVAGAIWNKAVDYNIADGEPASLSWKTYMSFMNYSPSPYNTYLSLKKKPTMIFDGGYLIVNLKYKLSASRFPHSVVKSEYDNFSTQGYYDKTWSNDTGEIGAGNWPNYTMFPCLIKVGDYFYNGETWMLQSDYNDKVAWWNTLYSGFGFDYSGNTRTWYRTWNTAHNDWEYVTETQYNSFSGTKETGQCTYAHAHYFLRYDSGSTPVYVTDEFYYQRLYGNYCFLIRNNTAGDAIMDAEYQLTNTVSYKMNIINSSEGMAIPITIPLYGELTFELYEPLDNANGIILGRDPQPQQSKANGTCRAVHISDLTLKYQKVNAYQDIFSNEDINPDTIYTNSINTAFCKELDDVELTVNTANDWANSYSYLIKQNSSNYDYIKLLQFNGGTAKRPEENLIEKYVNYYSSPKYHYGNTLFNAKQNSGTEIYPFQPFSDIFNNDTKYFVTNNITYNLSSNTADVNAFEI